MLYSLMDGHARTSTELSVEADVGLSTASAHLSRLVEEGLVDVCVQGRYRYYRLHGADVATVLEGLSVLACGSRREFVPSTPNPLRAARTCYDHIAGSLGVDLHDRLCRLEWISPVSLHGDAYDLSPAGELGLEQLGVDLAKVRAQRRRFAYACMDWSERRFHVGGALGAALLSSAVDKGWVTRDFDSRSLTVTPFGRNELNVQLGLEL